MQLTDIGKNTTQLGMGIKAVGTATPRALGMLWALVYFSENGGCGLT